MSTERRIVRELLVLINANRYSTGGDSLDENWVTECIAYLRNVADMKEGHALNSKPLMLPSMASRLGRHIESPSMILRLTDHRDTSTLRPLS